MKPKKKQAGSYQAVQSCLVSDYPCGWMQPTIADLPSEVSQPFHLLWCGSGRRGAAPSNPPVPQAHASTSGSVQEAGVCHANRDLGDRWEILSQGHTTRNPLFNREKLKVGYLDLLLDSRATLQLSSGFALLCGDISFAISPRNQVSWWLLGSWHCLLFLSGRAAPGGDSLPSFQLLLELEPVLCPHI